MLKPCPVTARLLHLTGWLLTRVEVTGLKHLPAKGPYLLCPNHQGYFNPFLLCRLLPYRVFREMFVVGAAEYFQTPLTQWLAWQVNLVLVDPDSALVSAMKAGAFDLLHMRARLLFPEGERSIDGTMKRFKKGAPILAALVGHADCAGGAQGDLGDVAAHQAHRLALRGHLAQPPREDRLWTASRGTGR